jgi:outer membrane protein OmpA-like peptidoglycan-associated protein
MATTKPMLGEVELQLVQKIDTEGDQVLAEHGVPALEGDFFQGLGRRAERLTLSGVLTGPEAGQGLKTLREKFRAAEPISFVADIGTATKVDKVFIEEMGVRDLAGKPERFEYAFALREFLPPPPAQTEKPPPPPPPPDPPPLPSVETGTLVVEVIVEGQPEFDFSTVTVTLDGTRDDKSPESRTLANRADNIWTEEKMPPGQYTVRAVVTEPQPLAGEVAATVRGGQATQVQITLRSGIIIAKAFVIHFRFDRAFVEPCMRSVLERVFDYAQDHPDEKILVVGHTDLVGSDDYNQSLSERRARSVFAYLTFGTSGDHRTKAIEEWNNLRRHAGGALTKINDNWGTREYQYILQDLGHYTGNIDEDHGPKTDAAVRAFQQDQNLPVNGLVDDVTWPKLGELYLEQDALAVPEGQFLPNANGKGCDGGILKWLGCGEQDPVKNTQDAWRPNRRTEILFVKAERLPCEVATPVTLNLPPPGPGEMSPTWCLGPGEPGKRCCFLARGTAKPDKWLVQPAEPGKIVVDGRIVFDDGTPAVNQKYVLIAPDGEFLHTDAGGKADPGEVPQGPQRGRPIPNRTGSEGEFRYPRETPVGVYILEMPDLINPSVARNSSQPPESAVGNVVCLRPEALPAGTRPADRDNLVGGAGSGGGAKPGATIHPAPPPPVTVNPVIEPKATAVVVGKSYTKPKRVSVKLKTSSKFGRSGTLSRSSNEIRFFTAPIGGTEISFDNKDNVFSGGLLSRPGGVELFAQGEAASSVADNFKLTLTLAPGSTPIGPAVSISMTALALVLDIQSSPPGPNLPPPALPQPPDPPPAPGTATDKWFGGGIVNVQAGFTQERVLLRVTMQPTDFKQQLTLRQVRVAGTTIGALDNKKVNLFDNRAQTPGETPLANAFDFDPASVGLLGRTFGIEGKEVSATLRDTGFQLGVKDVENDGDRIAVTIGVGAVIQAPAFAVVKKAHTTPTRQTVSLFVTAPFNRKGKFERSQNDVRFFDQLVGGKEITFVGGDNVFTGKQLFDVVELFAEGRVASAVPDAVVLTLTLDPGPIPPAGTPAIAKMTSVELTLDVAVSRTSPATDPAPVSELAKINPGRFVQVKRPDLKHERAMLLVRKPNPSIPVGTLVLTPLNLTQTQLFNEEIPQAAQMALVSPQNIPDFILGMGDLKFFIEGQMPSTAARDAVFQLTLQGQPDPVDFVNVTVVEVDVIDQPNNAAPAATFARMGLWDKAFRAPGSPGGLLFNDAAEANNFAGADSRKFHLRVRDMASRNAGHVNVDWRTLDASTADLDNPLNNFISLVENPANSGVFISRGLLLVSDNDDRNQPTHHGVPAAIPQMPVVLNPGDELRARGESNHRVRRGSIVGDMVVEYKPAAGQVLPVRLPVFQRTPETRRRLPLQVFVLRIAPGGAGVVPTAPGSQIWTTDLRVTEESYARFGIEVETVVAPGTPAGDIQEERPFIQDETVPIDGPRALTVLRKPIIKDARNKIEVTSGGGVAQPFKILYDDNPNAPGVKEVKVDRATGKLTFSPVEQPKAQDTVMASYVVVGHRAVLINVPAGIQANNVKLADEATIGGQFPTIGGANIVRVFIAGGLATGVRGESAPDIDFPTAPDRGTGFINQSNRTPYTIAHEIGHMLTNKPTAAHTGHFVQPPLPANNRLQTDQNLMRDGTSSVEGIDQSKRLWDAADADGLNQLSAINRMPSPYTRNF